MVNIKVDTKPFEERIRSFRNDIPKIGKKLMAYVFAKMRQDIRGNIKSNFKRRKGWLLKDLNYWAFDDLSGAIFSRNSQRQGAGYASVLENGATISAKGDKKWLVIYAGHKENWRPILKKVKSVTIPARPFFGPVVNDYWGGGGNKAAKLMEEGLEKEIKKYVEKKGGGLVIVDREEE
jgi:hypothetical protein